MKIITNNHPRDLVPLIDVPTADREDFDYITEDEAYSPRLFHYKNSWYDANEFCAIIPPGKDTANPFVHRATEDSPLRRWDGIQTDSFFSAVVIRFADRQCETVVVGQAL